MVYGHPSRSYSSHRHNVLTVKTHSYVALAASAVISSNARGVLAPTKQELRDSRLASACVHYTGSATYEITDRQPQP